MIAKETFVPMAFLKKETYTGSMGGMRYWVKKEDEQFKAAVYPEPYCYEATPEERKTRAEFEFTPEGREAVIEWLNTQYESRKTEWEKTPEY